MLPIPLRNRLKDFNKLIRLSKVKRQRPTFTQLLRSFQRLFIHNFILLYKITKVEKIWVKKTFVTRKFRDKIFFEQILSFSLDRNGYWIEKNKLEVRLEPETFRASSTFLLIALISKSRHFNYKTQRMVVKLLQTV